MYSVAGMTGDHRIAMNHLEASAKFYLLDEGLEPLPEGMLGEIYIGGEVLASGYYREPERTAKEFMPDPFAGKPGSRMYRTGDFGWRCIDGSVEYAGRRDGRSLGQGLRAEAEEIEAILSQHPEVREAAVMMREIHGLHDGEPVGLVVAHE